MKSMLTSMAVVLTFCAAPAASAEFPKTGEAEYDTYYVFNTLAEIDSGAGKGAIVDITGITRKNRCTGNRTAGSNPTASPLFFWRNWPCSNYRDISAGYSHQIRQKATTENEVIHCRRSLYGGFSVPQFGGPVRSASIPAGQTVRSQTPALRPRRANRTNCLRLVGVVTGLATPPAQ